MSHKISYFLALILGSYLLLVLTANSSGAGFSQDKDRTGSPLSNSSCNGCHSGGGFGAGIEVNVLDDSIPVSVFEPGKTYKLQVSLSRTGFPAAFGFQAAALTGTEHQDAGSFGVAPAGTRVVQVNGRNYFEHSRPNSAIKYVIDWTPEASISDTVWLYVAGIAANGNGSTSGDQAVIAVPLALAPGATSAIKTLKQKENLVSFTQAGQTLFVNTTQPGELVLEIIDLSGKVCAQVRERSTGLFYRHPITVNVNKQGIYAVRWRFNQYQEVTKLFLQ